MNEVGDINLLEKYRINTVGNLILFLLKGMILINNNVKTQTSFW